MSTNDAGFNTPVGNSRGLFGAKVSKKLDVFVMAKRPNLAAITQRSIARAVE
jgi:hypothetical protein